MENQDKFDEIAYKKAQKRVKEVMNFYYFVVAYIAVAILLLYRNYDRNVFNISRDYIIFMLVLQGIFLLGYGIYLFVPRLHHWEERKTKELMKKYNQKNYGNGNG